MDEEVMAMPEEETKSDRQPYRARLPGFVSDKDIGLGDAIKHVTRTFGIRPCSSCERRAATLNRWLVFTSRAR